MKTIVNPTKFKAVSFEEMMLVNGGGAMALCMSSIGLAVTPAILTVCPPAGISLGLTSAGIFYDNMDMSKW